MAPTRTLVLLTLFLLCSFTASSSLVYPVFNGYSVYDLTSLASAPRWNLEISTWTVTNLVNQGNISMKCSAFPILGGINIFQPQGSIQKTYTGLPVHNMLIFEVRFFLLDNIQTGDYFTLKLDDRLIPGSSNLVQFTPYFPSNLCGNANNDLSFFSLAGRILHSRNSLNLNITSFLQGNANDRSIGIRRVSLYFTNTTAAEFTCFEVGETAHYGYSGECSCARGYYANPSNPTQCLACNSSCSDCFNGTSHDCIVCNTGYSYVLGQCIQCDSSCASCSGSSSNQCITCASGYWLQRNNTCTPKCNLPTANFQVVGDFQLCQTICPAGQYLLYDGTCVNNCDSPLVNSTIDNNLLCNKPCSGNDFLMPDGTCNTTCIDPYIKTIQPNISICSYPCPSGEYLFADGSCDDTCDFPYSIKNISNISSCVSPCTNSNDKLYYNGSCSPTCISPLVATINKGVNECNQPCDSEAYLYPDNSCLGSCLPPFMKSQVNNVATCTSPCGNPSDYYLITEKNCTATCLLPNVSNHVHSIKTCQTLQISSQDLLDGLNAAKTLNAISHAADAGAKTAGIVSSNSAKGLFLVAFANFLDYIRYMEINYPPRLETMLGSKDSTGIELNSLIEIKNFFKILNK